MLENIVALVAATIVLILIPGPNVALIVANSLRHGLRFGLVTALGTTVGIAVQLFIVMAGFAALVERIAGALSIIKWLGVAYLVFLGIRAWREPAADLSGIKAQTSGNVFWHGVLLAIINPKTLLFNAAFLPQFIGVSSNPGGQLLLLTAVFLAVIICGDALWAVFAASARRGLSRYGHLRNRVTGGFLMAAGLGLALSRRNV
jgi:threonine/homoserine/homoserine lactone efflux protein